MTDDDIELIYSPLMRTYSAHGHTLKIQIYRSADSPWTLEIEDEQGTSTVWHEPFDSDAAALQEALQDIEANGIHQFLTQDDPPGEQAQPEAARAPAPLTTPSPLPSSLHLSAAPLTHEEMDALESYLLDLDVEDGMTLDMLDGYLHALAIGPVTVMPSQWLPKVWGSDGDSMTPPADSLDETNHWLGLVMRHFNSIVAGLEQDPRVVAPCWPTVQYADGKEFADAEMWAYGFSEGVKLGGPAWKTLLDDPKARLLYRPIGLLGEGDFCAKQDALTRTPQQREALAAQIGSSLLHIHAFWLPLRQAMSDQPPYLSPLQAQPRRTHNKVGRNEPCPCGSGIKFKKCCGAGSGLH